MARVGKSARMPQGTSQGEGEGPLVATLLEEFQNLKEKFKNEDDEMDAGMCTCVAVLTTVFINL